MKKPLTIGSLLLLTTAMVAPAALAQTLPDPAAPPSSGATAGDASSGQDDQEKVDISIPGGGGADIVVTGKYIPEPIRATPEVVSVLSTAEIARTGEGDIAGALQRVTGLSVVGNGFVYVRGLGDRYSAALLNGSPLPSPEPLKRVVPLDIFPTNVLASALVQKSYSANYPAEFGGGVINLTTKAVPREPFLEIGGSISGDSETTGQLGYTYYGSGTDWLGFDGGNRKVPRGIRSAISSGVPLNSGNYSAQQLQDITASLSNAPTTLLQRNGNIPANFSADLTGGKSWDLGDGQLGLIAAASYSNSWRTRDVLQQLSLDPELEGIPRSDFQTVITENHILLNGLVGLGYEFGDGQAIRWTNLYIRDVLKQGRLASGYNRSVADPVEGQPDSVIEQNTYWFERQLIDTQLVGEFKVGDFNIDLRGTYANSKRKSPYERSFSYTYNVGAQDYINNLSSGGQDAYVAFSDLNEDVYAGAADVTWNLPTSMKAKITAGYAYTKTDRTSSRYIYQYFRPDGALPLAVAQERPDYLVSDYNVYTYNIQLRDVSSADGSAAYDAGLEINAGYVQGEAELMPGLSATAGVRYEDAEQTVLPIGATQTRLKNDYFLPAATITWNFAEDMQLRLAASKTLARPQFRELAPQLYQDYESDRQFTGNPRLTDSKLTNFEARYEYYFGRGERLTVAGFYKNIDKPIETVAFIGGGDSLRTGFANAPKAELYGAEADIQKYFALDTLFGGGDFWATRRLMIAANYTYTQSKLKVDDSLTYGPQGQEIASNLLFRDGAPLTGQSDHVANLQIGFEDTDHISQQTLLISYASKRVTNRGPIRGTDRLPDIVEKPGLHLDLVMREEVEFLGSNVELKFEARNLTGTKYQEYQQSATSRIYLNRYDVGRSFSLGAKLKF